MITMRVLVLAAALAVCGCSYMRHPTPTTTWGQPSGAMLLGLEARGEIVTVFLQNRSAQVQRIIAKGFTLTIEPAAGSAGASPATQIVDAKDISLDSDATFEELKPGESLATPISLQRLRPGTYTVAAAYGPQVKGTWWTGSLTAGPIQFVRP